MAIPAGATAAVEAIRERFTPTLETLDETVREGRRMIQRGRHRADDAAATAVSRIRERPLRAVVVAAGMGVFGGLLIGVAVRRFAHCREA
jgi:ElaB/YqjD/DUF883 family membrane-anchored ribosome-binding protein